MNTSFNNIYNLERNEALKRLDDTIKEEKTKQNSNKHKIYRMMEQKLIEGMFSNQLGSTYGKFRSPW